MLLLEGKQQIISSLRGAIQFQHIYLYLFQKLHFYLSCKMKISMALIFLKKYTAYADDTTFFLKDEKSIIELMKSFNIISTFSGLNRTKINVNWFRYFERGYVSTLWSGM